MDKEAREVYSYMRPDIADPVGMKYGDVEVIAEVEPGIRKKNNKSYKMRRVKLRCKCGRKTERSLFDFLAHRVVRCRSCSVHHGHAYRVTNEEMIGKRYGRLTVDRVVTKEVLGGVTYVAVCTCDCGKKHEAVKYNLLSGCTTSCGCARSDSSRRNREVANKVRHDQMEERRRQIIGQHIGRLTVLSEVEPYKYSLNNDKVQILRRFEVKCDCGTIFRRSFQDIVAGRVIECNVCARQRYKRDRQTRKSCQENISNKEAGNQI